MPKVHRWKRRRRALAYWTATLAPVFWPVASWLVWRAGHVWAAGLNKPLDLAASGGEALALLRKYMMLTVAIPLVLCLFGSIHVLSRMASIGMARSHQPEKYAKSLLSEAAFWVCFICLGGIALLAIGYVSFFFATFAG